MATYQPMVPNNLAPDFIRFLFSFTTKTKFDCYFSVGNESSSKKERIGAIRLMLMAHSEVFRRDLEDLQLKNKKDIPVKDITPDAFKGMLKYVYGHDTTADMCFIEANKLFYVAEKYIMKTLKDKLALRLMDLLNPDNICSLLNNPACHTHLELNSAITQIIRYETDRVLAGPQFLFMNAEEFLKILVQDGLAVPEIELWKAAIQWAKHKAKSAEGKALRQQISALSPQLRVCTMTTDEISKEVATTDVLTKEEIGTVCLSIWRKEKPKGLRNFSNEIEPRKVLPKKPVAHKELVLTKLGKTLTETYNVYKFTLLTKQNGIELLPLVCRAADYEDVMEWHLKGWYQTSCTTTITKVANPNRRSAEEPERTLTYQGDAVADDVFEVPLTIDGKNVTLLPNTEYKIEIVLGDYQKVFFGEDSDCSHEDDNLKLTLTKDWRKDFPSTKLQYKVIPSKSK